MSAWRACGRCLARSWLLARLDGHLERARARNQSVLALDDQDLIAAVAGKMADAIRRELERFDPRRARELGSRAQLDAICGCDPAYPAGLRELAAPPAVLYVAGGLERFLTLTGDQPVAIVGARRASPYGIDVASRLGHDLSAAGLTVVSGLAVGVDSAAHQGVLGALGRTVAVLPAGAERAYPASRRRLHQAIRATGASVSELPPASGVRKWMFPARNRIIAALSAMTIVVEAGVHSGALVTARIALELGRELGAVPGRVTSALAAGPNGLISDGALLVRDAQDVLDGLFGAGARRAPAASRPPLSEELRALLAAIGEERGAAAALARVGLDVERGLVALTELELAGYVRREAGGSWSVKA